MVVELVASRAAELESWLQQVDESLGVAELGRGHPVEVAVAEELARRVGRWGGDDPVDLAVGVLVRFDRHGDPVDPVRVVPERALVATRRAEPVLGLRRRLVVRGDCRTVPSRPLATAASPPPVEDAVVGLAIVPAADEDRLAGGADRVSLAHVDEGQRSGEVDRRTQIGRQTGGPERPAEPDRLGEEAPPVDLGPPGRANDRRIVRVASVRHRRRPQAVAPASWR